MVEEVEVSVRGWVIEDGCLDLRWGGCDLWRIGGVGRDVTTAVMRRNDGVCSGGGVEAVYLAIGAGCETERCSICTMQ